MNDIYDAVPPVRCAACGRHVETIEVDPTNPMRLKAYCHGKSETQPLDLSNPKPMTFFQADGLEKRRKQLYADNALHAHEHASRSKSFRSARRNGWRHPLKTS